jgi:hypothetical protein
MLAGCKKETVDGLFFLEYLPTRCFIGIVHADTGWLVLHGSYHMCLIASMVLDSSAHDVLAGITGYLCWLYSCIGTELPVVSVKSCIVRRQLLCSYVCSPIFILSVCMHSWT